MVYPVLLEKLDANVGSTPNTSSNKTDSSSCEMVIELCKEKFECAEEILSFVILTIRAEKAMADYTTPTSSTCENAQNTSWHLKVIRKKITYFRAMCSLDEALRTGIYSSPGNLLLDQPHSASRAGDDPEFTPSRGKLAPNSRPIFLLYSHQTKLSDPVLSYEERINENELFDAFIQSHMCEQSDWEDRVDELVRSSNDATAAKFARKELFDELEEVKFSEDWSGPVYVCVDSPNRL